MHILRGHDRPPPERTRFPRRHRAGSLRWFGGGRWNGSAGDDRWTDGDPQASGRTSRGVATDIWSQISNLGARPPGRGGPPRSPTHLDPDAGHPGCFVTSAASLYSQPAFDSAALSPRAACFAAHPNMEHHAAAAGPGLDTQHGSASGHEGAVGGAGGRGRDGRAGRRTMMTRATRPAMRPPRPRPQRAGRTGGSDAAEGAQKRGPPTSVSALLPGSPGAPASGSTRRRR